jgi:hypothetical protein
MTKYMLVSCTEREFDAPRFFDTRKDAHAQMESELLEQIGSFDDCSKGDEYGIEESSAWANPHVNSDWVIYALSVENGAVSAS